MPSFQLLNVTLQHPPPSLMMQLALTMSNQKMSVVSLEVELISILTGEDAVWSGRVLQNCQAWRVEELELLGQVNFSWRLLQAQNLSWDPGLVLAQNLSLNPRLYLARSSFCICRLIKQAGQPWQNTLIRGRFLWSPPQGTSPKYLFFFTAQPLQSPREVMTKGKAKDLKALWEVTEELWGVEGGMIWQR